MFTKISKMNKCPRCRLPHSGIVKCPYCGFNLSKYNKKHLAIFQRMSSKITGGFKGSVQTLKQNKRYSLTAAKRVFKSIDAGERRIGTDRRKLKYITYYPERRSGKDRRKKVDPKG